MVRACAERERHTYVCNAVSESRFRVCGRGHAWREAVCRAHVSFLVPSLHRYLYLRCPPAWRCAAERDNAALTCAPLTQGRMAALGDDYQGPRVTCAVRARDACACLAS